MERVTYPWVADTGWVVLFFIACLLVLHLVFVVAWPLSKRGWHIVDYVWLSFACIGLIAAADQSRRLFGPTQVINNHRWANVALRATRQDLGLPYYCRSFNRVEYSPPDLENIKAASDSICNWTQAILRVLPDTITQSAEANSLIIPDTPVLPADLSIRMETPQILARIDYLKETITGLEQARALSALTRWEVLSQILGAPLLALALALRITKVSAGLLGRDASQSVTDGVAADRGARSAV